LGDAVDYLTAHGIRESLGVAAPPPHEPGDHQFKTEGKTRYLLDGGFHAPSVTLEPCYPLRWVEVPDIGWPVGKAINSQCPACGQMAEAWHREKNCLVLGEATIRDGGIANLPPGYAPAFCGQPERIIRCKRCNTAHYQDAEGGQ